jgi:hypothetical protein
MQKLVTIRGAHTTHVKLVLTSPSIDSVPVSSQADNNFLVSDRGVVFSDPTTNYLYSVDQTRQEHLIDSDHGFTEIHWADYDFGVGKSTGGKLYLIQSGVVSALKMPAGPQDQNIHFAVAPDHQIYVAENKTVYRGGPGGFTKIYSVDKPVGFMVAGNNAVAISASRDADSNLAQHQDEDDASLFIINLSNHVYPLSGDFTQARWSPDGTKLVVSTLGDLVIWSDVGHELTTLPVSGINSVSWYGKENVLYAVGTNLWSFNLANQESHIIFSAQGKNVSSIVAEHSPLPIFLTLENQGQHSSLFYLVRIAGGHETPSSLEEQLEVFLPNTINGCSLGYTNFSSLVVTVISAPGSEQTCLDVAHSYLQEYGVNPSGLNFNSVVAPAINH